MKTGACTSVFILLEGESFRMGTFGRLVFCVRQNTDCRKNEVFRQSLFIPCFLFFADCAMIQIDKTYPQEREHYETVYL